MKCGVCERSMPQLCCEHCSRTIIRPYRYDILCRISERDNAAEKVHDYIEGPAGEGVAVAGQKEEVKRRTSRIRAELLKLQEITRSKRESQAVFVEQVTERRKKLREAQNANVKQEQLIDIAQRDIKKLHQKWKAVHARTAEARSFLCREAAMLYGLRLKRRKGGNMDYLIGGVTVPNYLQDLNVHPPIQISTGLAHLAHLLVLVSHYLGLKLPNDVILPGRDNPLTSIRGVLNGRHMTSRPLHLDAPLATLSRENPSAHTKFIEGIAMLAIDVAYLCFTQGLEIVNVEDACNPGHNLWRLLVPRDSTAVTPSFGRTSHATASGNIATAPGQAMMGRFKLGYKVVVEKIRFTLQSETIVAGWDLVPEAEKHVNKDATEGASEDLVDRNESPHQSSHKKTSSGGAVGGWTRIKARGESK